jgi:hypothetical protein
MAEEAEDRTEETEEEAAEETQEQVGTGQQPAQQQRMRLNFEGVSPQYANFCTLTVRQGEVFLSFGKAFVPTDELKVDSQIVMSMRNVQQLHQAMGRLLEQQKQQAQA